jgi:hypothetical protein
MSSDKPAPHRIAPDRLMEAIRRQGMTYSEAAERARAHLPPGSRLSHTSIWSYATGRASPKRLSYIEAIEKAMGVEPHGLCDENGTASKPQTAGGTAAADASTEQSISMIDNGDGTTFLAIKAAVPWPVAIQILEKLKGGEGQE